MDLTTKPASQLSSRSTYEATTKSLLPLSFSLDPLHTISMIRRLSTAWLSGHSAAAAFVLPARSVVTFNTVSPHPLNGWVPTRDGLGAPLPSLLPSNGNPRRKSRPLSSSMESGTEKSLPQDLGEKFEIYLPPKNLGVMTEPPRPDGTTQPRGTVHRLGYWHRSVHIWLYNVKVMGVIILSIFPLHMPSSRRCAADYVYDHVCRRSVPTRWP